MQRRTHLVDRSDGLPAALALVDEPLLGVDVERADADNYFRRAALVQVGTAADCILIDTVALELLPVLHEFLADRTIILHALENDLVPLQAAGVDPPRIEDTAIAASLLGLPIGLDPLLQELLGVSLSPDKERFQRADWAMRPLPADMLAYAADDVFHLPRLWLELADRLTGAGRMHWYEQERGLVVQRAAEDRRDWQRVRGAGKLDPRQRAVLRTLWESREELARADDIAPNRVLREEVLVNLAQDPARDPGGIIRRNQRRRRPSDEHATALFQAQQDGRDADPVPKPSRGRGWDQADRRAYDALRKRRAVVAKELGLDAGTLCPSKPLWDAVLAAPQDGVELCEAAGMRPWQVELLAEPLWEAFTKAYANNGAAASGSGEVDEHDLDNAADGDVDAEEAQVKRS